MEFTADIDSLLETLRERVLEEQLSKNHRYYHVLPQLTLENTFPNLLQIALESHLQNNSLRFIWIYLCLAFTSFLRL